MTTSPDNKSPLKTRDKISPKLIKLLGLSNDDILFHKRLDVFTRKNGKVIWRKLLFLTASDAIIIGSRKRKDAIPLSSIATIEGKAKYYLMYSSKRPLLLIRTTLNDVYEIALSPFEQHIADIDEIGKFIKRCNPKVEIITNELFGNDPIYSPRDKKLLLLLPFIILLLALALRHLFHYLKTQG